MFVAALSISGIPPTNGFASKWLVYQACVAANQPVFLVAALFGSVLTLASFVKVLHSVFWGARPARWDGVRESGGLGIPVALIVLAAGCVALGVFADAPLEHFFGPAAGLAQGGAGALSGAAAALAPLHGPALASALALPAAVFAPAPVTGLLLLGTLAALTLAYLGQMRVRRVGSAFVGGEPIDREVNRFPGPEFYRTVADLPWLGPVLRAAEAGRLDPYEAARRAGSPLVALLRRLHTGLLQDYLFWCLLGAAVVAAVVLWR
jgi:NADH:ubiquinone oxidoreductase subunit 5 (subunit L)/multisubunit Na+/H+ antiporter MnhA subunit